ncbi:MAG: GTPase [Sandaracinaceae bacterium]
MSGPPFRCIVMGAAGRDFHDFLSFLRARAQTFRVVAFTAEQIPFISERSFPRELAGPAYAEDIPIHDEEELVRLIREHRIDFVFLSYSDLAHEDVMHRASVVQAAGASFALLGPEHTQLRSTLPVLAVTAVRTGAGKSPLSQAIAARLTGAGRRVGVLRHPMPYGDLRRQGVQRFATTDDLDRHECTVEEREEYEPYVERGLVLYAGVDYRAILERAEAESDVILWDGGNNDVAFVRPDLHLVIVDALRPGHEVAYYPGETNLRRADVVVINKVDGATADALRTVRRNVARAAPGADVVEAALVVTSEDDDAIRGRRVLVVEDGPTTTHGGMPSGAGLLAAERAGATVLDPRPFAVGTVADAYRDYPHLGPVLPALGYSETQRSELAATIRRAEPEVVVDGSPARLDRLLRLEVPVVRVRYRFAQRAGPDLFATVDAWLAAGG